MTSGPGPEQSGASAGDGHAALARLRAAASDLDTLPADGSGDASPVAALAGDTSPVAALALAADRYEALHEALTAVLADVDRT